MPSLIAAQTKERVAMLPFTLHMGEPADHLSLGLQEMLTTRLEEKGFELVDPHTVNEGRLSGITSSDVELLRRVAVQMGVKLPHQEPGAS
jgi:hypothetical protein